MYNTVEDVHPAGWGEWEDRWPGRTDTSLHATVWCEGLLHFCTERGHKNLISTSSISYKRSAIQEKMQPIVAVGNGASEIVKLASMSGPL